MKTEFYDVVVIGVGAAGLAAAAVTVSTNLPINAGGCFIPWNEGYPVWWHLTNVRLLKEPIPCWGNVGMWELPEKMEVSLKNYGIVL